MSAIAAIPQQKRQSRCVQKSTIRRDRGKKQVQRPRTQTKTSKSRSTDQGNQRQPCENSQTRLNYLKAQATWGISVKDTHPGPDRQRRLGPDLARSRAQGRIRHHYHRRWRAWLGDGLLPGAQARTDQCRGAGKGLYRFSVKMSGSKFGGAKGARTPDLLHAMQALSQLSYGPIQVRATFATARIIYGSAGFSSSQ